jgi:phage FluMu gp28-like protein
MSVLLKHEQMARLAQVVARCRNDKCEFAKVFFGKDLRASPWQVDAVNIGGTISTKVAGRRSGKTLTTTVDAMHSLATHANHTWYVTGPSLDQASLYFNEIEEAAQQPNGMMEALLDGPIKRSPFPSVKLITGSELHARSTARDGVYLRGKGANGVAVTEAAFIKDKVYQEVIRAMVLDRGGTIKLESTPNGQNYFQTLHNLANGDNRILLDGSGRIYTDPSKYYRTIHATVFDNLSVSRDEIQRIKLEVPEYVWLVEYLAQFVDDDEQVFAWSLLADLFDEDYPPELEPGNGHRYVMGVDLAQVQDYTAIIVLNVTFWPVRIARWQVYRGKPYTGTDSVVSDVNRLRAEFNNARVLIDATTERGVAEQIVGAEAFVFSQKTRNEVLSNLQVLLQNRKFELPAGFTRLRDELRALRRVKHGQSSRVDHPDGGHDDTVTALALASWPLRAMVSPGSRDAIEAVTSGSFA